MVLRLSASAETVADRENSPSGNASSRERGYVRADATEGLSVLVETVLSFIVAEKSILTIAETTSMENIEGYVRVLDIILV